MTEFPHVVCAWYDGACHFVHGATRHTGRRPERTGGLLPQSTEELTSVIGLRRSMQEAIACEDYEQAQTIRDSIRGIEARWLGAETG